MKTPHPDEVDIESTPKGFFLTHVGLNQWFKPDGTLTDDFEQRGVYFSAGAADRARARFCSTFWRGE